MVAQTPRSTLASDRAGSECRARAAAELAFEAPIRDFLRAARRTPEDRQSAALSLRGRRRRMPGDRRPVGLRQDAPPARHRRPRPGTGADISRRRSSARRCRHPAWRKSVRFAAAEPGWWSDTPRGSFPAAPANNARVDRLLSERRVSTPTSSIARSRCSRPASGSGSRSCARSSTSPACCCSTSRRRARRSDAALVEELIRFQMLAGRSVLIASHDAGLVGRLAHARLQLAQPRLRRACRRGPRMNYVPLDSRRPRTRSSAAHPQRRRSRSPFSSASSEASPSPRCGWSCSSPSSASR